MTDDVNVLKEHINHINDVNVIDPLTTYITINDKLFEKITIENNIDSNLLKQGIPIVEKFIRDRNLILYGGQAIDFALRLHNTSIYPDDAFPDYDMYSPDSVQDSYDLTNILAQNNMPSARSVPAFYVRAMKNSVSNNRSWIADFSYVPPNIFPLLPTLTYKGMRLIHPHYQIVDLHQSLSSPFQNPSMGEPIFARFKKDIERYNLIIKYYPFPPTPIIHNKPTEISLRYVNEILIMFPAYGAMLRKFNEFTKDVTSKYPDLTPPKLFQLKFTSSGSPKLTFETYNNEFSIIHCNTQQYLTEMVELSTLSPTYFEAFINIIPKRTQFTYQNYNFTIYNTSGYLISYSEFNIDGLQIRVASIQYQLKLLLANYLFAPDNMKDIYLACYNSLISMIQYTELFFSKIIDNPSLLTLNSSIINSPFMLPVKAYGFQNCNPLSDREEIIFNNIELSLGHTTQHTDPLPKPYTAGQPRPPKFNYNSSKYFRINGTPYYKEGHGELTTNTINNITNNIKSTPNIKSQNQFKYLLQIPHLKIFLHKFISKNIKKLLPHSHYTDITNHMLTIINNNDTDSTIYTKLHEYFSSLKQPHCKINNIHNDNIHKDKIQQVNSLYSTEQSENKTHYKLSTILQLINSLTPTINTILDFGCGDCTLATQMAKHFKLPPTNVYGLDIIQPQLDNIKNITFINNIDSIPPTIKFDLITAIVSLHHIPEQTLLTTIEKLTQHLSPHGYLIIQEHDYTGDSLNIFLDIVHGFYALVFSIPQEQPDFINTYYTNYQSRTYWSDTLAKFHLTPINHTTFENSQNLYYELFIKK